MQKDREELKKFLREVLMGYDKDVEEEVNVAGAVIYRVNQEQKIPEILLIKRSEDDKWPNRYEHPRGRCNKGPNEKIFDCLIREVKEEVGLKIKIICYLDKFTYIADEGKRRSTQYNFLCKLDPQDQGVALSREHSEYKWVISIGEVELLVSTNETIRTLKLAFEKLQEGEIL